MIVKKIAGKVNKSQSLRFFSLYFYAGYQAVSR